MVMSSVGLGTKNHCAGEGQQLFISQMVRRLGATHRQQGDLVCLKIMRGRRQQGDLIRLKIMGGRRQQGDLVCLKNYGGTQTAR
jgi:hypothetical protein